MLFSIFRKKETTGHRAATGSGLWCVVIAARGQPAQVLGVCDSKDQARCLRDSKRAQYGITPGSGWNTCIAVKLESLALNRDIDGDSLRDEVDGS